MRLDAEIRGLDDVERIMTDVGPRAARNLMRSTVGGLATELAKDVRGEAPRDEGDLRSAIRGKRRRGGPGFVQADVVIAKTGFYWMFLEFGTEKLAEIPFIRPAVDRFKASAMDRVLKRFARAVVAMMKRQARLGR